MVNEERVYPTRLEQHEKMHLRAAAFRATRVYSGPVGECISRELLAWEEFGQKFGSHGKIKALADEVMHPKHDPVRVTELWRPVIGWEGIYSVSSFGRIKREKTSYILTPTAGPKGHMHICLQDKPRKEYKYVHRIALEAYVGPCPKGMECCHNDGDPGNNKLINLRWDTSSNNNLDIVAHGRHFQSLKQSCPRLHKLEEPNLVKSKLPGRECLSCSKAKKKVYNAKVRKNIDIEFEPLADAIYYGLMEG